MLNFRNILLSLFILQPWLLGGIIRFDIIAIAICFFIYLNKNKAFPINEFIFILFSLATVSFFSVVHLGFDISLLKKYITLSILILGGFYVVNGLQVTEKDLLKTLYFIVIFCFFFYLLSIKFDVFRDISLSLKGETYGLGDKLEVYRLWFPTSAHTFLLGLFFVVTTAVLLCMNGNVFIVLLCIICASIAARSALLMSISLCVIYMFLKDRRYIFILFLLIPIGYFIIEDIADRYDQVKYALEPIEQFLSTGTFQSKSSDELMEKHLFLPDLKSIILGDGLYTGDDGKFYKHTDSGILRPLLYGGILFQLFYFIFLYRYIKVLRYFGMYGVVTIIFLFGANVKAEILSTTPYFSLIVVLYYMRKNKINS